MKKRVTNASMLILFLLSLSAEARPDPADRQHQDKQYDLVLVHGLANRHKWSNDFLEACLEIWGSGRIFVVYTNSDSLIIRKKFKEGVVTFSGGAGKDAGIDSIALQTKYLTRHINQLHGSHGLNTPFSIIAHSMGGLVSRRYIYENPETVAGLVTLGTPHHGSPLADTFDWGGFIINAPDAVQDLRTASLSEFNRNYPVAGLPLAVNRKMYTIHGGKEGLTWLGPDFQIQAGNLTLSLLGYDDNDGLVPLDSAMISGAENIADFPEFNHNDLVRRPETARAAASVLP